MLPKRENLEKKKERGSMMRKEEKVEEWAQEVKGICRLGKGLLNDRCPVKVASNHEILYRTHRVEI